MSNTLISYLVKESITDSSSADIITQDEDQFEYDTMHETISDSSSADVITNDDEPFEYAGADAVTKEVLLTYPIEESIDYATSTSSGDVSTYDDDMFLYAPKHQE